MKDIRPIIPFGTHPIETGRYIIETNEIKKLNITLSNWIGNRVSGGIIYGRPRLGKTRAIKFASSELSNEYGANLPIFNLCCRLYKSPVENTFFEDILKDVGHALFKSGKAADKRERLKKFLIEQGEKSGLQKILIFIDDAQRLVEMHYGWLMDIYNDLDRYGINLTIILVGQPEIIHQREAFRSAKKGQIIGRFMVQDYKFNGIKNFNDIRSCLANYDDTIYPEDMEWSFTRYYFPELFSEGFRLENCADDVFTIFTELRAEAQLKKPFEIPMQYLTRIVEYVLRKFGVNGENLDKLSMIQWREAILESGYIEAEIHEDFMELGGNYHK